PVPGRRPARADRAHRRRAGHPQGRARPACRRMARQAARTPAIPGRTEPRTPIHTRTPVLRARGRPGAAQRLTGRGPPRGRIGMSSLYGATPVNRRRRTRAELAIIDDAIAWVAREEHPATLRGVFYRVESAGVVEKTEQGYELVQRQLL